MDIFGWSFSSKRASRAMNRGERQSNWNNGPKRDPRPDSFASRARSIARTSAQTTPRRRCGAVGIRGYISYAPIVRRACNKCKQRPQNRAVGGLRGRWDFANSNGPSASETSPTRLLSRSSHQARLRRAWARTKWCVCLSAMMPSIGSVSVERLVRTLNCRSSCVVRA